MKSKCRCPLLYRKTKIMTLRCRYDPSLGKLDYRELGTIEHCIICLRRKKRYIDDCFFFAIKELCNKRDKIRKVKELND